jgi:hypothetical protein
MKHAFTKPFYSLLLLAISFTACRKNNDTPFSPETPSTETGDIRPIGVSIGNIVSKEIGAAGGSLQSADGSLSLSIPAGALAANTIIGIEPITNTNLAGIGKAFRLTPHGQQFAKPVEITYSYAALKDSIAMQEALGLSYQDSTGAWNFMSYHALDTTAKTVVYKSSHFSDWGLMPWISLNPFYRILSEDEELHIDAYQYIPYKKCNCNDDFLVPPLEKGYPVGLPKPLDKQYIKEWKLNGPGFLISGNDNYADYKAPATIPVTYTSAISLRLNSAIPRLLVCNVTLMSKDNFEWRFNNGPWLKEEAKLVSLGTEKLGIAFVQNGRTLSMNWPAGTISCDWGTEDYHAKFNFFPDGASRVYASFYKKNGSDYPSAGGVTMTLRGKVGEYCAGTFMLSPSGLISTVDGKQSSTAIIEGRFKLKRY